MSWDADLVDDRGHNDGCWNYTHNCNVMANTVLAELGCVNQVLPDDAHSSWWKRLDGCDGPTGAAMLHEIIQGLEADPERFRAMNPENGWGDYDSFLKVLTEMRNAVPEWPTVWEVSG